MKYDELIAFEPIDSVKVLTEADSEDLASRDVSTFVISPQMRRMLVEQILPHLRLDGSVDTKGVLVVANYGTGKTHLMSTVSSVLERAELAADLRDEGVRKAVDGVAGSFKVMRAEIGATKMGLRESSAGSSNWLKRLGVEVAFPPLEQVSNTKDSLVDMMAAFEKVEPERGLLFVLDELLDYLRSRRDAELIVDLSFLREVGEISRSTRFRFIAGFRRHYSTTRASLPRRTIGRVRDRFEQVRISREDVAYVVQERLLRKDAAQKAQIRQHLERFTPAFEGMAEHLEDFVALYPVHPSYLRTFERVTLVEKRRVLSTLSHAMAELLETEVPTEAPGLVCYDSYRSELDNDPSNRSITEVALVLDRAQVLRSKLQSALPQKEDVPVALRIVDALAVYRLTTEDIDVPIGLTVDELRDDLCLIPEGVPELEAGFIGTTLESVVAEIVKAVSGQFLSRNDDNGQLFLDVRKDIDYDQLIQERADSLDDQRLDDAYFRALEEVLEQRELRTSRLPDLVVRAPVEDQERHTPRLSVHGRTKRALDRTAAKGLLYLLPPALRRAGVCGPGAGRRDVRAARVPRRGVHSRPTPVCRRRCADSQLDRTASTRLRAEAPAGIADNGRLAAPEHGQRDDGDVPRRDQAAGHLAPTDPGGQDIRKGADRCDRGPCARAAFRGTLPRLSAVLGRDHEAELRRTVQAAISQVATRRPTALGTKVLTSLGLADMNGQIVTDGEFAKGLVTALDRAGGKALNRSEILTERDPGVLTWGPWHLEPSWLVVVAAALCHAGRLELGYPTGQVDALGLDRLTKMSTTSWYS